MEYVSTNNAPGAIGPYSQAVKANGLLFTSGQIAINPETNMVEAKTIEEQTHQVCKNLKAVVEALDGLPPVKIHCSVLAEEAVKAAVKDYYDKKGIEYDHAKFASVDCAECGVHN